MIRSVDSAGLGGTLAAMGPTAGSGPQPVDSFAQQLYEAVAGSLEKLGVDRAKIQLKVEEAGRQDTGGPAGIRQLLVTILPAPAAAGAIVTSGKVKILRASDVPNDTMERLPPIPSNSLSVSDYEDPVPELVALLHGMGIDTSRMSFELLDEVVSNIGGRYTNHLIRVDVGNGMKEDFSVEWTLRNPKVTAFEIQRLLRMGTGANAGPITA